MVADADPLLSVESVVVRFGGILALDGVSLSVARDSVFGLIGPNGAGKTTFFNCLSGLYRYSSGDIRYSGRSLSGVPANRRASAGIGRTFQNLAMFRTMTVRENILVGAHCRFDAGILANALRLPNAFRAEEGAQRAAARLIELLELDAVSERPVADLPFGTQKRVELARALASRPKLLLLDEPACGLNHEEVDELSALIRRIRRDFDVTILLVEHHMGMVMGLCDHIAVLNFGRKIAEGTPREVRDNPEVVRAYLGEG
ncbi:ABC transporter ATP-binding protein [Bosea sp. F3-2]|uniref:ABC transporter ATP-binding protein n=1 Tax=Bosea sp. F3-2 TaxID=2599640 RepID=UPI0011F01506|nr:ABC transporter ATP-binding protein [Bosea sp. F3-2]QEL22882.1 ABC transporter ATP-binding protein [Bosea sp. F3-2]